MPGDNFRIYIDILSSAAHRIDSIFVEVVVDVVVVGGDSKTLIQLTQTINSLS